MGWWRRATSPVIGLDVGSHSIKAVQLTAGGALRAVGGVTRREPGKPLSGAEVSRLASALRRQGFVGSDIITAAGPQDVLSGMFELPPLSSGAPVTQLARSELAQMHGVNPGQLELCCWDLPEGPSAKEVSTVMALGCLHESAEALLDAFDAGGLTVQALDLRATALARACKPLLLESPKLTAILDVGHGSTGLVLCRGDVILYERDLPEAGLKRLAMRMTEQLGLSEELVASLLHRSPFEATPPSEKDYPALREIAHFIEDHVQALVGDLHAPLAYALGQYGDSEFARVLLVGGGARAAGLRRPLAALLEVEVIVAGPDVLVSCPPTLTARCDPSMTAALGLAMSTERLA